MPGFKYQSKYLLAFAVTKHHLSLFPTSGPIDGLKDRLQDYDLSKGTLDSLSTNLFLKIFSGKLLTFASNKLPSHIRIAISANNVSQIN